MAVKYANILHSKALQNVPKLGILLRKYTHHLAVLAAAHQNKKEFGLSSHLAGTITFTIFFYLRLPRQIVGRRRLVRRPFVKSDGRMNNLQQADEIKVERRNLGVNCLRVKHFLAEGKKFRRHIMFARFLGRGRLDPPWTRHLPLDLWSRFPGTRLIAIFLMFDAESKNNGSQSYDF
jgi:hypothetical protein